MLFLTFKRRRFIIKNAREIEIHNAAALTLERSCRIDFPACTLYGIGNTRTRACAHTHTDTHIHTHIHTLTHTETHTHTKTHTYTLTHTHTH